MKLYFSLDVESSGPAPGLYSMLSLGLCVVGAYHKQFYRELKPITYRHKIEALKVGCLGLRCLEQIRRHDAHYNPESGDFSPRRVLHWLTTHGEPPLRVMCDLNNWVRAVAGSNRPVIVAAPAAFDCSFVNYYFAAFFDGTNPFGHSAEDINSFYRGAVGNPDAHVEDLKIPDTRNSPHNALEDALYQARCFETALAHLGIQTLGSTPERYEQQHVID